MSKKTTCPGCGRQVTPEHYACRSGAKGGAAGRGEAKARTSEQARAAVNARWSRSTTADGQRSGD